MAEEFSPLELITRRLDELSDRLRRVEDRLGLAPPPSPLSPLEPQPDILSGVHLVDSPQDSESPASAPRSPAESSVHHPAPRHDADAERPDLLDLAARAAHRSSSPSDSAPDAQTHSPLSIERLIGGKFYLIAGSIVVVIGVGLFLKLGYDAGWFRMAPAWKCLWGAAFGLAMLALGEVARTRVSAAASAGVSSAGMGALYAATYAAHGYYGLIGPSVALVLLVLVTATGIAVSARARLLSVAILSVIGGYAAPFTLEAARPNPFVLPLHLLALLAIGLVLSGWRPAPFRPLRSIVWWTTMLLGAFWVLVDGSRRPELGLTFLALIWCSVHAELMWSAGAWARTPLPDQDAPGRLLPWRDVRHVGASFSTTSWSVLLGVFVLRQTPVLPDWFAPAGVMVGAIILSIMLAGHLRLLRDRPETEAQRLGAGLAMQGGAMLIAVVALALQGWLEVAAWLALGVAVTAAASWTRSKGLGVYGVIVLSIAVARLLTYDAFVLRVPLSGTRVLGLVLDRWTLLALIASGAWIAAAGFLLTLGRGPANTSAAAGPSAFDRRLRLFFQADDPWWLLPRVAGVVGTVLLFAAFIHPREDLAALSLTWLVLSSIGLALGSSLKDMWIHTLSLLGLVAATGPWALAFLRPEWSQTARGLFVHPGFLLCLALTAGLVAAARVLRSPGPLTLADTDPRPGGALLAGCAMLLTGASLEVVRHAENSGASASATLGWLCASWIAVAAVMDLLRRAMRCQWLLLLALGLLELSIGLWAKGYALPRLQGTWQVTAGGYPVHPGLLVAFSLAAALVTLAFMRRSASAGDSPTPDPLALQRDDTTRARDHRDDAPPQQEGIPASLFAFVCAAALVWGATSFEIARLAKAATSDSTVQSAAVSIWWGAVAATLLFFGFRNRLRLPRYAGLGLLGVATVKAVVVDLADVPPIWRVASVLGLGLLMLAVAVVYAKVSDTLLGTPPGAGPGNGPRAR